MPDFEALIRHQQLKQPKTNQRLKVVKSNDYKEEKSENQKINNFKLLNIFFVSFLGSIIGTLITLFLYINDYLPMDLLKIN